MVMVNDLDRFHLVIEIVERLPRSRGAAGHLRQMMVDKRLVGRLYTREQGGGPPDIREGKWPEEAKRCAS
jgi:xylulose-5-phosphate/fructose-6-phosphate phosphoketolase